VTPPVTPSTGVFAAAFVRRQFSELVWDQIDPNSRAMAARQRRILELRRSSELREAERYGWLSLAAVVLGMGQTAVERIEPSSSAVMHRAGSRDVLPDPLGDEYPPAIVEVGDTGLQVSDPRDAFGFHVFSLAIGAISAPVIEISGRRLGGAAVAASLRDRLEKTNVV
jgi:hypothetical protein